jgi:hypothetical protein
MWHLHGFAPDNAGLDEALERLETHIQQLPSYLRSISEQELKHKPAPGKWSKQEVLGHLVDSGLNNLRRFTEILYSSASPYVITPYPQDELVRVNAYQQQPLEDLLAFWMALNKQIVWLCRQIPPEKLEWLVDPRYDNHQLRTFEWLIADYVAHMEHHLKW